MQYRDTIINAMCLTTSLDLAIVQAGREMIILTEPLKLYRILQKVSNETSSTDTPFRASILSPTCSSPAAIADVGLFPLHRHTVIPCPETETESSPPWSRLTSTWRILRSSTALSSLRRRHPRAIVRVPILTPVLITFSLSSPRREWEEDNAAGGFGPLLRTEGGTAGGCREGAWGGKGGGGGERGAIL